MATDNLKRFDDFLDRMQEILDETRKLYEMEEEKPFDYENATIVQKDFAPIKPKFKEGDWIVFNEHTFYIREVAFGFYKTISFEGVPYNYDWCIDRMARLWTIEDAKEGDVLCDYCEAYNNPLIFILKKFERVDFGLVRPSDYSSYCFLTMGDRPRFKEGNFHHMHDVKPATEEQRDTLIKAMHESGYTFDFEKKELNKVESKFHVGDWVVDSQGLTHQIGGVVENVTTHTFGYDIVGGGYFNDDTEGVHLWTIQDAKDGDVLTSNDGHGNDCIELIKSITNEKIEFWFCLINGNRYEVFDGITPYTNIVSREDATPATKEQRDTLIKAMHEAGYTFDFEKKELKKIECKFRVGDWIIKKQNSDITRFGKFRITDIKDGKYWYNEFIICEITEQDEWETVKVEPEFHVGDWITNGKLLVGQVTSFDGEYYHYMQDGIEQPLHVSNVHNWHLWTIEDAKDGDVLAEDSCLFIIRKLNRDLSAEIYCCLFDDGDFSLSSNLVFDETSTYPATKEQREELEKAMHKAGYEWIEEKKELKRVEPKFHEGDWIVTPENNVLQIASIEGTSYTFNDEVHYWEIYHCDKQCHLWTIQDAKEGDVLACGNDIIIFKENNYNPKDKSGCMFAYCSCNNFREIGGINPTDYKPATKEQREELEKAMADSGYVFDFKKKKLKKIEEKSAVEMKTPEESLGIDSETYNKVVDECIYGKQEPEPKWTEKDKENISMLIDLVESKEESVEVKIELSTWLKALKDRVQPQPKQEWSEDDEEMCYKATTVINRLCAEGKDYVWSNSTLNKLFCWLKSLKEKVQPKPNQEWKPTDEQIRELGIVATGKGWFNTEILGKLLEQLKKLKKN